RPCRTRPPGPAAGRRRGPPSLPPAPVGAPPALDTPVKVSPPPSPGGVHLRSEGVADALSLAGAARPGRCHRERRDPDIAAARAGPDTRGRNGGHRVLVTRAGRDPHERRSGPWRGGVRCAEAPC